MAGDACQRPPIVMTHLEMRNGRCTNPFSDLARISQLEHVRRSGWPVSWSVALGPTAEVVTGRPGLEVVAVLVCREVGGLVGQAPRTTAGMAPAVDVEGVAKIIAME